MEKQQVIISIENALKATCPAEQVSNVCRQYLKDKIEDANMRDLSMKKYLLDIVEHYQIQLDFGWENQVDIEKKHPSRFSWLGIGVAGLATSAIIATDNIILKSFGCLAIIGGGCLIGRSIVPVVKKNEVQLVCKSSAEEIFTKLSQYIHSLGQLFDHSSLETCDKEVLRWLQKQYCESKNAEYKESIEDLLEKCCYEFCPYSLQSADFFDTTSGNVDTPKTTYYAVRNQQTDDYVLRGHVILPKK